MEKSGWRLMPEEFRYAVDRHIQSRAAAAARASFKVRMCRYTRIQSARWLAPEAFNGISGEGKGFRKLRTDERKMIVYREMLQCDSRSVNNDSMVNGGVCMLPHVKFSSIKTSNRLR